MAERSVSVTRRGSLLLVLPPVWDCFQPYGSLPALTGHLRERGFSVHQADLSLAFYLSILHEKPLAEAYRRAVAGVGAGTEPEARRIHRALRVVGGPYLAERCQRALDVVRGHASFYSLDTYRWALATLEQACRLWSSQWEGVHLSLGGAVVAGGTQLAHLRELATDPIANPFYEFLKREVEELVGRERPDVVGVSVVQEAQLLGALTVAGVVRRVAPGVPVVAGGPLITSMASWWGGPEPLSPFVDGVVIGPGEDALDGLLRNTPAGRVPNLATTGTWPRRTWWGSVSRGPTPDFDGLPLGRYLCPETVYPLTATRGCYWNRCAFCNLTAHGPVYQYRGSSRLAADMEHLATRYGARFFDLAGEVIPLRSLVVLGREVSARGLDARWHTQSRLDRNLAPEGARQLYDGGCRRLKFGLESACQRVLDLMDKGTRTAQAARILQRCVEGRIALTLFLLVGFPGELPEESWETAEFLLSDHDLLDSRGLYPSFSSFYLERNSRVAAAPERYGVDVAGPQGDASAGLQFRLRDGMSPQEVQTVRGRMARAFSERSTGRAWPFASSHSLLYLDRADQDPDTGREEPEAGRHYTLAQLLEGRPVLRPDVCTLPVGEGGVAYDGAVAASRSLGRHAWHVVRLCDGRRGSEVCAALESAGLSRGEALMGLAQIAAAGLVTV
jgi:hypothetical protein